MAHPDTEGSGLVFRGDVSSRATAGLAEQERPRVVIFFFYRFFSFF